MREPFVPSARAADRLDRIGLEFLDESLRRDLARHPGNVEALAERALVLTLLERYEEGLRLDRELVARRPEDPTARYNLACSYALCGAVDEALETLEQATGLGYADPEHLLADPDFEALRGDPRFAALVERLRADA